MGRQPIQSVVSLPPQADPSIVHARFCGDPAGFLPPPAEPVDGHHRVALSTGTLLPVPTVMVSARVGPASTPVVGLDLRALTWTAERAESMFPRLEADLELHWPRAPSGLGEPIDDASDEARRGEGELRLIGAYTPPLALVGAAADRLLGHHVASEVIRAFLTEVAERLCAPNGRSPRAAAPSSPDGADIPLPTAPGPGHG